MDQHVISEWLLKAFAGRVSGGLVLDVYDTATGLFENVVPAKFMTEVDAHSTAIEQGIGDIEGPAAKAAIRLAKRVKVLAPGLYAVVPSQAETGAVGPALSDQGVHEGMRLLVSEHQVPSPSQADRIALLHLGRFTGPAGEVAQRTETTSRQAAIFTATGVAEPPRYVRVATPPPSPTADG